MMDLLYTRRIAQAALEILAAAYLDGREERNSSSLFRVIVKLCDGDLTFGRRQCKHCQEVRRIT